MPSLREGARGKRGEGRRLTGDSGKRGTAPKGDGKGKVPSKRGTRRCLAWGEIRSGQE